MLFFVILLFPIITLGAYSNPYNDYITKPLKKMVPNGKYIIYILKNGQWQEVGKLTYDKYFRERELNLSQYLNANEKVHIRLEQKGGGAAHIDSIFLGKSPPMEVKHIENGLKKLSKKDFDVINVFETGIEILFKEGNKNKTLSLTARVEGTVINKLPFQFPLKNLGKAVDMQSHFYSYKLNSRSGSMKIDGMLNEINNQEPFFKGYSKSGTGHPSNFTYGWVRNDDEHLYVAIDFTGDNTIDGDKDYAKVYVKTKAGVKEFKVSVPETKWGTPGFVYTDKVNYQHKVYEFKIPLKELSYGDRENSNEVRIAFAAYGTDTAGQIGDFVWDDENGNGLQDGGEPGVGGIRVDLYQCSRGEPATYLDTTITDSFGAYGFGDLDESAGYAVRFFPGGRAFTLQNQGADDTIDSDADPVTGYTHCVNTDDFDLDAGLGESIPTLTQWGMIIFMFLAGLGAVYYLRRQRRLNS